MGSWFDQFTAKCVHSASKLYCISLKASQEIKNLSLLFGD